MQKNYRNAYNELKKAGVPVFERADTKGFSISGEEVEVPNNLFGE